jgi:ribonuclease VapC
VIAVDSSALLAILRREPEADVFLNVVPGADGCVLSSTSLLETSMVLAGRVGDSASWTGLDALIVRYGKGRHPAAINLGDRSYSLAKTRNLPLLFKGKRFFENGFSGRHLMQIERIRILPIHTACQLAA